MNAADQRRRELEPYLKFVRNLDPETDLETRIAHVTYDFFEDGVEWLAATLEDCDLTVGFSVPAVYLDRDAAVRRHVRRFASAGHEIVLHGYRHTSYMETPYEIADEELAAARGAFDRTLGVDPVGFHVPFMRCSPGTVRAAEERGVEWVVGTLPSDAATTLDGLVPESPYDLQLVERGLSPTDVTERLTAQADGGRLLLCHPNVHAARGSKAAFADWLAQESFSVPSAAAAGDADSPGLLLDCFPPFEVR